MNDDAKQQADKDRRRLAFVRAVLQADEYARSEDMLTVYERAKQEAAAVREWRERGRR